MADDTPAEKAETQARQMNFSIIQDWRGGTTDDFSDYWTMQNARNDMLHATFKQDKLNN